MKLLENKKMLFLFIAVGAIIIFSVYAIPTLIFGSRDENVESYKLGLSKSLNNEIIHYTKEEMLIDENGELIGEIDFEEFYKMNAEKLYLSKSENIEYHDFLYNGYTYNYNINKEAGTSDIFKKDGITPIAAQPNRVNQTYYSIDDRYVTYEETDSQFIVRYENKFLSNKNDYISATSVAYFDKEWCLEKIEFTEIWNDTTEDGKEYVRTRKIIVTYHDTSEEEIKSLFEKEYIFLESLLVI